MNFFLIICLLCIILISSTCSLKYGQLIWSDEFDYTGKPDPSLWYFQNNSLNDKVPKYSSSFTDQNAYVSDGFMTITAKKEQSLGKNYSSSGLLSMRGFRYGIFEMRAKLGGGRGTWANFLLSPDQRRTGTLKGEIDIAEVIDTQRYAYNIIHSTIHYDYLSNGTSKTASGIFPMPENPDTTFHVYACDWNKDRMFFYVDGIPYHTYVINGTTTYNIRLII